MIRDRVFFGRATPTFTLQWHLTNACPFHCRHCYDRSDRQEMRLSDALAVVANLQLFCRHHRVSPQISLSGGDPLCYSGFWELYETIAEERIPVSILGNPTHPGVIDRLIKINAPMYYQVSLEGLSEHNDYIRGQGHFERVMAFLKAARSRGLKTSVMLTLTRANMSQVLPLAEELRGLTGRFTFNRLAQVGEGAGLEAPAEDAFRAFLVDYLAARKNNPILAVKDNLFNLARRGGRAYPGCTGFGCGAAFNFVALLPDGEVHACRKFPSAVGRIRESSLIEIFDSPAARDFRAGPTPCRKCRIRHVCGGCSAVTHGNGLSPLKDRDPYCWMAP